MPRVIQERLVGYSVSINRRTETIGDNGHVIHDGKGQPKTRESWDLISVDHRAGHSFVVGLDDNGRKSLVAALTGGIVHAVDLPQGVEVMQ